MTAVIQERNDSSSEQASSSGGGKKWLDSRHILKKEPTRFGCKKTKKEKGVNDDSKVFGLK